MPRRLPGRLRRCSSVFDSLGNTRLNFRVLEKPNEVIVQITDNKSGELIRQFPSEDALALRAKLQELTGLLFDDKA